jgi:hypothetical protein
LWLGDPAHADSCGRLAGRTGLQCRQGGGQEWLLADVAGGVVIEACEG